MAKRKRKHGKIEKKKSGAFIEFKLDVLLLLIILSFAAMFGLYIRSVSADPDYWENEIVGNSSESTDKTSNKNKNSVTNPVPVSERAEDTWMSECAFIGDVSPLTSYYATQTEFVFTDSITSMTESRMKSISRSISDAKAVYIWCANAPDNAEEALSSVRSLANILSEQNSNMPVYVLTALPSTEAEASQLADEWNTALFALADEIGLHYVDVSTTLKSNDNILAVTYQNEEALYQAVGEAILTHIA